MTYALQIQAGHNWVQLPGCEWSGPNALIRARTELRRSRAPLTRLVHQTETLELNVGGRVRPVGPYETAGCVPDARDRTTLRLHLPPLPEPPLRRPRTMSELTDHAPQPATKPEPIGWRVVARIGTRVEYHREYRLIGYDDARLQAERHLWATRALWGHCVVTLEEIHEGQ